MTREVFIFEGVNQKLQLEILTAKRIDPVEQATELEI